MVRPLFVAFVACKSLYRGSTTAFRRSGMTPEP
jgi:hypothetical protein